MREVVVVVNPHAQGWNDIRLLGGYAHEVLGMLIWVHLFGEWCCACRCSVSPRLCRWPDIEPWHDDEGADPRIVILLVGGSVGLV